MAHSIIYYQAWVRWLLCNDIIPKAIPLSERLAQCPHLAGHVNTMKLVELARTHRLWYTQDCSSHMRGGRMSCHWQVLLMTTPWHSLPHHQSNKPTLFHSLSTLTQHALAWGHSAIFPTSLSFETVDGTLPAGSLAEAHNCEKKKQFVFVFDWLCFSEPGTRAHFFPWQLEVGIWFTDTRWWVPFEFEVPVKIPCSVDSNLRPRNSKHTHFQICHEALLNNIMSLSLSYHIFHSLFWWNAQSLEDSWHHQEICG